MHHKKDIIRCPELQAINLWEASAVRNVSLGLFGAARGPALMDAPAPELLPVCQHVVNLLGGQHRLAGIRCRDREHFYDRSVSFASSIPGWKDWTCHIVFVVPYIAKTEDGKSPTPPKGRLHVRKFQAPIIHREAGSWDRHQMT